MAGRHCERKRSNPALRKTSVDCFVAMAPRNDEFDPSDLPAMANQIRAFGLRQINPTGKSVRAAKSCQANNFRNSEISLANGRKSVH
jgi:hypothetical protein